MGVRLTVDRDKLWENYKRLKELTGVEVIPVLKSNAYGLGLLKAAFFFAEQGVKILAVSRPEEALALCSAGISSHILLLSSGMQPEVIEQLVSLDAIISAGSLESLRLINEAAERLERKLKLHLYIDTGFNHSGIRRFEYEKAVNMLQTYRRLKVTGIFTHFSESHSKSPYYTEQQTEEFEYAVKFFSQKLGTSLLVHASNSAAALKYAEMRYDAVRVGSALIGRVAGAPDAELNKIGSLECDISEIKLIEKGEYIGYSRFYKTTRQTRIAIIPIGISDGIGAAKLAYGRSFFKRLKDGLKAIGSIFSDDNIYCQIKGEKSKILGKIGQNSLVCDITDIECEVGDTAVFEVNPINIPPNVERIYI